MSSETLVHHAAPLCLNCRATTHGNYCQQCGQATHLHVPSAREFLHEFIAHYVALEGKLWKSLGKLVFRPGFLTREYIEGRRARYLEPLRLYLTFSILFFALFKLLGGQVVQFEEPTPAMTAALAEGRAKETLLGPATLEQAAAYEGFLKKLEARTTEIHPQFGDQVRRFNGLPPQTQRAALKTSFFSYTPYAIFLLMPVFALYLKLLYLGSGRRYGEHFLFGLHTNAFAFLLLALMIVIPSSWGFATFVLVTWLMFYLPLAMRRVYGGGRLSTVVRWIVLIHLHMASLGAAVLLAMGQVLLG